MPGPASLAGVRGGMSGGERERDLKLNWMIIPMGEEELLWSKFLSPM